MSLALTLETTRPPLYEDYQRLLPTFWYLYLVVQATHLPSKTNTRVKSQIIYPKFGDEATKSISLKEIPALDLQSAAEKHQWQVLVNTVAPDYLSKVYAQPITARLLRWLAHDIFGRITRGELHCDPKYLTDQTFVIKVAIGIIVGYQTRWAEYLQKKVKQPLEKVKEADELFFLAQLSQMAEAIAGTEPWAQEKQTKKDWKWILEKLEQGAKSPVEQRSVYQKTWKEGVKGNLFEWLIEDTHAPALERYLAHLQLQQLYK
ncbi:MAG TPA: hypothetical protein VF209_04520 [Patescibacteria group bacterium]